MSEYNIFPAVDANYLFPEAVRRAMLSSPEFLARFLTVDDAIAVINQNKAPLNSPTFTGTVKGVTKAHVGLDKVDNTSDLNKPVSTAVKNAYIPRWKSGTAYALGEFVVSPENTIVTSNAAHTSSSAWSTDIAKWNGASVLEPYGHMGKTNGFQALNAANASKVDMQGAQELRGGFTFDSATSSLVVPRTGRYRAHVKAVFSGGGAQGLNAFGLFYNGGPTPAGVMNKLHAAIGKNDSNDVAAHTYGIIPLTKGDKIGMYAQSGATVWGNNGYNGAHVELEWVGL